MYHNKAAFISAYLQKFQSLHGKGVDEGSTRERYEALAGLVRDLIAQKWARTNKQYLERGVKQVYYFSIEYLQGRILITNLLNLDLLETCTEGLDDLGINLAELTEPVDLRAILRQVERSYLDRAYARFGNVRDAAKSLGLDPSTFVRRRKRDAQ